MATVLIVEDSQSFGKFLIESIKKNTPFNVLWAKSLSETRQILEESKHDIFIATLDLHLPDAEGIEIVDFITLKNIPAVTFTGDFSDDIRDQVLQKGILDYFLKEHLSVVESVVSFISRFYNNSNHKVLVVDDSTSVRHMLVALLRKHRYQVLEAARGQTALDLAEKHKDIKLAIIDFHMPEMDGFLLTKKLRLQFRKERMAIIGLSSYGNNILSAKFIKYGANDFISKPFLEEEFYCRVSQNIDFIDHFSAMEKSQKNMVELNNLLLEAAKLRDDMDSIMRHDLKNPLGIVISGPEIIQEVGECNAAQKEILRGIETSGFRLLEMINRSLDLYKIENGKYDLHQAEVDLGSVVEKAMSELAILCRSKEISLKKIEGKQRELSILGEDMLCHSIFSNLIKNAIEASPFRENIEISIRVHGNMALTQIHNRGQVPQEIRNSFFDKFVSYQKTAGTGIGTYSSRLFARLQGGDIHLDTETDPQGTIVIVSLPLVKKNFGGTASKPSLGEDNPPRPPATTL